MVNRRWAPGFLLAAGFFAASAARAQFVPFTRCHGAYPCNVPFVIQYKPDPLIAGPYPSAPSSSAVSAHVELKKSPEVVLDKPASELPLSDDPVEASVRAFLKRNPGFKPSAKAPAGKAAAKTPPASEPPKPN